MDISLGTWLKTKNKKTALVQCVEVSPFSATVKMMVNNKTIHYAMGNRMINVLVTLAIPGDMAVLEDGGKIEIIKLDEAIRRIYNDNS